MIHSKDIAPALGAEIFGIDLANSLVPNIVQEIHQMFLDRSVLVFRNQTLTPKQQVRFARYFGSVVPYPFLKGLECCPEVLEVITRPEDGVNFGGGWHTDTPYLEIPSLGSVLYAKELPPVGGDTIFSNMYLAYDALDKKIQNFLDGQQAVHSANKRYAKPADRSQIYGQIKQAGNKKNMRLENYHPIIRTHPETSRKSLFVSSLHTTTIKGMEEKAADTLLARLYEHQASDVFTCRVVWEPDTLVIWDNRCVLHNALFDYAGYKRRMHRVTIEGDRPT